MVKDGCSFLLDWGFEHFSYTLSGSVLSFFFVWFCIVFGSNFCYFGCNRSWF